MPKVTEPRGCPDPQPPVYTHGAHPAGERHLGESRHVIGNSTAGAGLWLQAEWVEAQLHFSNAWAGQAGLS